jgi:glycine cleavage system aminomethyltransferase T/glycine/D-amino acid oxidase-like deaminating enzyme
LAQRYDVLIVGGGIIGASIAYHLATTQPDRSVCLLERAKLTSGTTWHAAGLVAELRASANLTRLAKYSGELYESLQAQGEPMGYKRVGALTLAKHPARVFELQKQAAMARHNGVVCDWVTPPEIAERWPHIEIADLLGGVYMPNDGQTNPVDTTLALARLARQHGATILEDTKVTQILVEDGVAVGANTAESTFHAEQVVLCTGLWTRDLGLAVGADFPLYAAEHFYAVTEPVAITGDQPIVRVPDDGIYLKPDAGRLLIGCFEREAKPIAVESLPSEFAFAELPFDLDHFTPYLEQALLRIPAAANTGIRTWFNGPESFTPDGRYMLGESPDVAQLFVAAGFNSIGIQSAGGVGRVMAQWLRKRRPPMDLWEVDVRRFASFQNQPEYLVGRTAESLGLLYAMHWPYYQHTSARNQRRSPIHDQLAAHGACFGELAGWERANWFAQPGTQPTYEYSYGKQNWFERTGLEHNAVRTNVALFDQTSFAKYSVEGRDACELLNRLSTANLDVPVNQVVYCQWLNERAGIEADVTITRISETRYWVVSAAASTTRDLHWLRTHGKDYAVDIRDITQEYAVFGIMGPHARQRLQPLTNHSLAHQDFAFGTSADIDIGQTTVRATRITYVGALGWELYVPWDAASEVYAQLTESPITHAGYHAMDSLRMEKAYRHWGHDITDEDTPLEAGLSFTVDWHKPGGFIGDEVLTAQKERGVSKRLALFQLADSDTLLTHDEPIWCNSKTVGHIVSSAYSYGMQCSLGFGYVHGDMSRTEMTAQTYEIEVADRRVAATASLRALHDPENKEIHG